MISEILSHPSVDLSPVIRRNLLQIEKLYESSLDLLCCFDVNGKFIQVNNACIKLSGYTRNELLAKTYLDIVIEEDLDKTHKAVAQVALGKTDNIFENRCRKKDGTIIPIQWWARWDAEDQYYFCAARDISDRKKAERAQEKLAEYIASNEKHKEDKKVFEYAAKATRYAIWDWDVSTNQLNWEQGLHTVFGYKERITTIETWIEKIHDDDREIVVQDFFKHIYQTTDIFWEKEYRFKKADGSFAFVCDRGYVVRDKEGHPVRMVGSMEDITNRKVYENEILELNDLLKKRYEELSDANKELEQFALLASHELLQPVSMIIGFMDLLQKKYAAKLDEKAANYLFYMDEGVKRIQQLVTELKNYSTAQTEIEKYGQVDCNALIEKTVAGLEPLITKKQALVRGENLPIVNGYRSQLEKVFRHFISNALTYVASGVNPEILITARKENNHWLFCIKDNGIGIKPGFHKEVFNIFRRLHTNTTYTGTGIGLAICKKIIEKHNGTAWVESEPGKGSSFFFTLPA